MISAFRHLIVFVEKTLMTLQFSVVFFLKGQFLFKCWELPHRKQFRQFLERCPSCPQALHLKLVPPRQFLSSKRSVSVTRSWRWKSPPIVKPTILLLFSVTSVVTSPSPGTDSLPRLISTVFSLFVIY